MNAEYIKNEILSRVPKDRVCVVSFLADGDYYDCITFEPRKGSHIECITGDFSFHTLLAAENHKHGRFIQWHKVAVCKLGANKMISERIYIHLDDKIWKRGYEANTRDIIPSDFVKKYPKLGNHI